MGKEKGFNCEKCPHYKTCKNLCAAAEYYVDQDNVPRREHTLPSRTFDIIPGSKGSAHNIIKNSTKSKKEQIYELFFLDKRMVSDIVVLVGVSDKYIYKIIKEVKKKAGII